MTSIPDLKDIPSLPDEIIQAGLDGHLVLFVGAGTSKLMGLPTWKEYAAKVLQQLLDKGLLNHSEFDLLTQLDAKKQLSIAEIIAKDSKVSLDYVGCFKGVAEGNGIYKSINDIGCPCVTTNYDELLAPRFLDSEHGASTPAPIRRISNPRDLRVRYLNEPGTVVHLHGSIVDHASMVISTRQYLQHYDKEEVQVFLGELFESNTVLFLGYGLEESEILEHILRRGRVEATSERRRFSLQGFYLREYPLYRNLHRYYESSFGVHIIGYSRDHGGYKQEEAILRDWTSRIKINKPALIEDLEKINLVLSDGH